MTKRISAAFLAAAALGLAAAPAALDAQRSTPTVVTGQVVDAGTGAPLANVVIEVERAYVKAVTAADGQFRLRLRPGTYDVSITRLGYEDAATRWEAAGERIDVGAIRLTPDPVLLEGITATVDRIDRVRHSVPFSSRTFGEAELATSSSFDAAEFVTLRAGRMTVECGYATPLRGGECVRFRGGATRACVVVDDSPLFGGLAQLMLYRPSDFARMHVYRGGTFIQAYTPEYVKRLAAGNLRPLDTFTQMRAYCRGNV